MIAIRILLSLFAVILVYVGIDKLRLYQAVAGTAIRFRDGRMMVITGDDLLYTAIGCFAGSLVLMLVVLISWIKSKRAVKTVLPDPPEPPKFD